MLHSLLLYIFIHSVLVYDMNFAKTSGQLSANCPRPGFMVFSCTVGSLPIHPESRGADLEAGRSSDGTAPHGMLV